MARSAATGGADKKPGFRTILVPVDGSTLAEQALPLAVSVARACGAKIVTAHVHHHAFGDDGRSGLLSGDLDVKLREREIAYVEGVARTLASHNVKTETAFLEPPVVQALLDEARLVRAELIVMATHGYSGLAHAWLGSVTDEMVRRSPVPLVLVRPRTENDTARVASELGKILVPLDGSRLAEQVLAPASILADAAGAEMVLLQVVEPAGSSPALAAVSGMEQSKMVAHLVDSQVADARSYLEKQAARLPLDPDRIRTEVLVAPQPAVAMLDFADRLGVSLIALSTHGRSGIADLLLGSMADKVLRGASIPVMFLRPRVEPVSDAHIKDWTPGVKEPLKLH